MSSMVTAATVTTVTTAVTFVELAQMLVLCSVLALAVLLFLKEIASGSSHRSARVLSRGLDIGAMPLIVLFAMTLIINAIGLIHAQ